MHYAGRARRSVRVAVHLRHRGAAHGRLRRPAADRHLRAADPARREDRLAGDHRARRRLGRRAPDDDGRPRRRRLHRQRRQDLHHLRRARRLRGHRGAHRRAGRGRGLADRRRQGHAGIRGHPQAGQDGLALLGHRRAVLHRRPGAGRQPGRRREHRLPADRGGVRLRARRPCRAGVRQRAALPGPHRAVVPRPRDLRQAADLAAGGAEHAGRDGAADRRRPGLHPHTWSSGSSPAKRT